MVFLYRFYCIFVYHVFLIYILLVGQLWELNSLLCPDRVLSCVKHICILWANKMIWFDFNWQLGRRVKTEFIWRVCDLLYRHTDLPIVVSVAPIAAIFPLLELCKLSNSIFFGAQQVRSTCMWPTEAVSSLQTAVCYVLPFYIITDKYQIVALLQVRNIRRCTILGALRDRLSCAKSIYWVFSTRYSLWELPWKLLMFCMPVSDAIKPSTWKTRIPDSLDVIHQVVFWEATDQRSNS